MRNPITRLFFGLAMALAFSMNVQAQLVTTPRPSPAAELRQTIGLTTITINYSRPQVIVDGNDRSGEVWGALVPFGLQKVNFACNCEIPWRAGANENTTFETSHRIWVEGEELPAGKYGLHMILEEDGNATLIFSHNSTSWGSYWYNEREDALRVKVQTVDVPFTNVLTYEWVDFGQDKGTLALDWERKRIPMNISVDVKNQVLASLEDELRGYAGFTWQAPMNAAQYCLTNNFEHGQAMEWIERSIIANKNPQNMAVKAALQTQLGDTDEAAQTAELVGEIADIAQLNQIGYQMLQSGMPKLAVTYFQKNVEKHPDDANCYDSLGEGYMALGKEDAAVQAFKTSLSKDPPEYVRANSIKNLEKLGVSTEEN